MSTHDKKLFEQRLAAGKEDGHCCSSAHCWHRKTGAIWMVVKDGHVLQECCRCPATRTIHLDHAMERRQSEDEYEGADAVGGGGRGGCPSRNPFRDKLDSPGNRWKLWAGSGIPGWTSEFERGRRETKFRC
jgi:hypothetical protein